MKKYIYPLAITAAMLATTACSDDVVNDVIENKPDSQKEMIAFTSEDAFGSVTTRSGMTRAGFTGADKTAILMHIVSTNGTNSLYTRTLSYAGKDATNNATSVSDVNYYTADYNRYWDDAYGRSAQLSIYAIAVPDKDDTSTLLPLTKLTAPDGKIWGDASNVSHKVDWSVTAVQTADAMAKEDLAFSNNIRTGGEDGRYVTNSTTDHSNDGYLRFNQTSGTTAGTFEKGHLIFTHALTRIVINLKEGSGFNTSSDTDFKFDPNTDTKTNTPVLKSMPAKGSIDISTGVWTLDSSDPRTDITMLNQTAKTGFNYTYLAQVLPTYEIVKDGTDNVLEFSIDGNAYNVTQGMLFTALTGKEGVTTSSDNKITLERGKRYNIDLTVNKSEIKLTASLVDWKDVNAQEITKDNAVTLTTTLHDKTDKVYDLNFDLYRLHDTKVASAWTTGYTVSGSYEKLAMTKTDNGSYSPSGWYYENSTIGYHFRLVNQSTEIKKAESDGDYFTMTAGAQSTSTTQGADYRWGAPFKSDADLKYTSTGWTNISPAIGANSGTINIIGFHMMSNVDVILKTEETPAVGNKSVVLYDVSATQKGCVVEFVNVSTSATVKMGTGLVTAGSVSTTAVPITSPSLTSATDYYKTSVTETKPFTYAFVPQTLAANAGIKITTPDGNVYNVEKLNTIKQGDTAITEWLPNHHYVYTFTLTKTGINTMTASLVDWTTVTATDIPIDLEK